MRFLKGANILGLINYVIVNLRHKPTKGNNKFLLDSVTTEHVSDKSNSLQINYDFSLENYVLNSSGEIFINPHLSKELENEYIDISIIQKDIYYSFKHLTSNVFCYKIPENYEVSFLPENTNYDGGDFSFSISYKVMDNNIYVYQNVMINTLQLKTEQFESWNKMIKGLFAAYKEFVVMDRI